MITYYSVFLIAGLSVRGVVIPPTFCFTESSRGTGLLSSKEVELSEPVIAMRKLIYSGLIAAALLLPAMPAQAAGLALTPAGVADGFTLTTFASGGSNYNFLAMAVLSDGTLAVVNNRLSIGRYNDVDNQTSANILSSVALSGVINIANAGGKAYAMSEASGLYQVGANLALTPVSTPGVDYNTTSLGLAGAPNGHLIAVVNSGAKSQGVVDINPLTGTFSVISTVGGDGVSVSPNGSTAYVSNAGHIIGYDIATHAKVFDSGSIPHAPDGTGVILGGAFNGFIVVNNNDGTTILVDPATNNQTIIATGGTRGDFTSPDTNDGSLLLAFTDAAYRLQVAGGTFAPVPEPTSLTLLGIGAAGLLGYGWRRRKQ